MTKFSELTPMTSTPLHLALIGLVAFFFARGVGAIVGAEMIEPRMDESRLAPPPPPVPVTPSVSPQISAEMICERNVFNYEKRPCIEPATPEPEPEDEDDEEEEGLPETCESEAELVGTVASPVEDWSFAMIESDGETMPYRAGDEVPGVGMVEKVGWRLVLMDRESEPDCLFDIYDEPEQKARRSRRSRRARRSRRSRRSKRRAARRQRSRELSKHVEVVSPTQRNVDRALVDQLMENPTSTMRRVRVRPHSRGGEITGFRLSRIRGSSIWSKLGLRNGDVVHSINGIEITSADRALSAYTKLRSTDHLTVTISRSGNKQALDFDIR